MSAPSSRFHRPRPWRVEVHHDGLPWVHVAGLNAQHATDPVTTQVLELFDRCEHQQRQAGTNRQRVVRLWLQLPDILGAQKSGQRYADLNLVRA